MSHSSDQKGLHGHPQPGHFEIRSQILGTESICGGLAGWEVRKIQNSIIVKHKECGRLGL